MNYLIYNGIRTSDYGIFISGAESFNAPEADLTLQSVPGRNGDLIFDNKRWKNISVRYPAFIRACFEEKARAFVQQMLSDVGYKTLQSTYDMGHFRQGVFAGPMEFTTGPWNASGRFDLIFTCKPQRFLTSGTAATTLSASGTINNPTRFEALPLIRVYGTGTVTVNGTAVTINSAGSYTDIDSEMQDCYRGTVNCNNNVTLTDFPVLSPGENSITLGTGITRVSITPRWYDL